MKPSRRKHLMRRWKELNRKLEELDGSTDPDRFAYVDARRSSLLEQLEEIEFALDDETSDDEE